MSKIDEVKDEGFQTGSLQRCFFFPILCFFLVVLADCLKMINGCPCDLRIVKRLMSNCFINKICPNMSIVLIFCFWKKGI